MAKGKYKEWLTDDGLILLRGIARHSKSCKEIADKMGINESTLYDWMKKYPEISKAVKRTALVVNAEIENSLEKLCSGFWADDGHGNTKYVPPNATAIIFTLKNRMPEKYRDKHDVELSGNVSVAGAIKAARERVKKLEKEGVSHGGQEESE